MCWQGLNMNNTKYDKIIFRNTMKIRISATIDEETNKVLDKLMKNGKYRNKSHIIEEAIKKEGGKSK